MCCAHVQQPSTCTKCTGFNNYPYCFTFAVEEELILVEGLGLFFLPPVGELCGGVEPFLLQMGVSCDGLELFFTAFGGLELFFLLAVGVPCGGLGLFFLLPSIRFGGLGLFLGPFGGLGLFLVRIFFRLLATFAGALALAIALALVFEVFFVELEPSAAALRAYIGPKGLSPNEFNISVCDSPCRTLLPPSMAIKYDLFMTA